MPLTTKTKLILFTLGEFYKHVNAQLKSKKVEIMLSKVEFIRLAIAAKVVKKKTRALYKNLETLEKKKLISYKNKSLRLTVRGTKHFKAMESMLKPYIIIMDVVKKRKVTKYLKTQTRLKV